VSQVYFVFVFVFVFVRVAATYLTLTVSLGATGVPQSGVLARTHAPLTHTAPLCSAHATVPFPAVDTAHDALSIPSGAMNTCTSPSPSTSTNSDHASPAAVNMDAIGAPMRAHGSPPVVDQPRNRTRTRPSTDAPRSDVMVNAIGSAAMICTHAWDGSVSGAYSRPPLYIRLLTYKHARVNAHAHGQAQSGAPKVLSLVLDTGGRAGGRRNNRLGVEQSLQTRSPHPGKVYPNSGTACTCPRVHPGTPCFFFF
jgi:hypothetical protein